MNTFLKKIILFTLFTIISYTVYLLLWSFSPKSYQPNSFYTRPTTGYTYTRLNEVKSTNNVDILFLGSSHAYRGFDNRIFKKYGYTSFNLGTSSQTPTQTLLLLKKYINTLKPKYIIYEVYPETFEFDGVESFIDIIYNDNIDLNTFIEVLQTKNIRVINTMLYKIIKHSTTDDQTFYKNEKSKKDTYIRGGFVERDIDYHTPIDLEAHEIDLNEKQINRFNKIIDLIKKNKIPYTLVCAPISKSRYNSYTNIKYFDSIMSKKGEYYNFNKIVKLNDSTDFYDSDHLNQNGVKIFNESLIKHIKIDQILKP